MRALLTAVIAAIEAGAIAVAGFALIAIPAALMWWLEFDFGATPQFLLSVVSGIWLLAHFVPLHFELDQELALSLGISGEGIEFVLSLAPLGVTLVTFLLALRAGSRFAQRGLAGIGGVIGGTLGFAGAATLAVRFADSLVQVSFAAGAALAAAVFGVAVTLGFLGRTFADNAEWWVSLRTRLLRHLGERATALRDWSSVSVTMALAALTGVLGIAALSTGAAIVFGYVEIVTLNQLLQLDLLGILLLFFINILLLPVVFIWALSWLSGAGFAIGTGTSVSPFETLLGPLPALPLFGAVPQGWGWAALVAPLMIVLIGVWVGVLAGGTRRLRSAHWGRMIGVSLIGAVGTGLVVTAVSALVSGSLGPGRLSEVGPDAWLSGGLVAAELALGMVLGGIVRRVDLSRLREGAQGVRDSAQVLRERLADRLNEDTHKSDHRTVEPSRELTGRVGVQESHSPQSLRATEDLLEEQDLQTTEEVNEAQDLIETQDLSSARFPATASASASATDIDLPPDADADAIARAYEWQESNRVADPLSTRLSKPRVTAPEPGRKKRRIWPFSRDAR